MVAPTPIHMNLRKAPRAGLHFFKLRRVDGFALRGRRQEICFGLRLACAFFEGLYQTHRLARRDFSVLYHFENLTLFFCRHYSPPPSAESNFSASSAEIFFSSSMRRMVMRSSSETGCAAGAEGPRPPGQLKETGCPWRASEETRFNGFRLWSALTGQAVETARPSPAPPHPAEAGCQ